ncbi:hypothetical protein, partial [Enterococcus faecium]|uniref:hypothetical protein n=1 Tax=Enterococcus faecium TaxID=1352 RepID=UPI0034E93D96
KITNKTNQEKSLQLSWQGTFLSQWNDNQTVKTALPDWSKNITSHEFGININFDEIRATWDILTSGSAKYQISRSLASSTKVESNQQSYISVANIKIASDSDIELFTTHSYFHNKNEAYKEQSLINDALNEPYKYLLASTKRWQAYL